MDVEIPSGAIATVTVPSTQPGKTTEGRTSAAAAKGVLRSRIVPAGLELCLASGRYAFETLLDRQ